MRSTASNIHKNRRKKVLKRAKGFQMGRRRLYRTAKDAVMKADLWAFRDRKAKKRLFRRLWITRINAGCRELGISYSAFMRGLKNANIDINRKMLSELAINQPEAFKVIVEKAKQKAA